MFEKLSLVLKNPRVLPLPLALKAASFGILVALGEYYSVFFTILGVIWALFFYFRSWVNSLRFLASFIVLLWTLQVLPAGYGGAMLGAILFFFLLSVKEMALSRYDAAYWVLHGALVFLLIFMFSGEADSYPYAEPLILFAAPFYFLVREMVSWGISEAEYVIMDSLRRSLFALTITFLAVETLWTLKLLPLSALNSAFLGLFLTIALEDFFFRSREGTLSRIAVLRNITAGVIFTLVIFGLTQWTP